VVRKTVSQLRDSRFVVEDSELAAEIGEALRFELGASRRATKTVMRWADVSDTTARSWLHGRASPSSIHLVALAAQSDPVMSVLLRLTGHGDLGIALRLKEIEAGLVQALMLIQGLDAGSE
jgi:hypothetical protein